MALTFLSDRKYKLLNTNQGDVILVQKEAKLQKILSL